MANKYAIYGSDPTQADTGVANGLRETLGPTNLIVGTITDGEFFKRSGNTIISEAISAVSASASSWTTAYSVDFTTLSSSNIRTGGNGSKTIDGKTWTWANDANSTTATVTNGRGIVIAPLINSLQTGNPTVRAAPIIVLPLSAAFPTYSASRHIVRVSVRISQSGDNASAKGVRLGFEDNTSPTNQAYHIFKGYSTSVQTWIVQSCINAVATTPFNSTTNYTDNVLSIVFEAPKGFQASSGVFSSSLANTFSGSFPSTMANYQTSEQQNMSSPLMWIGTQPRILLCAQDSSATSQQFTGSFTHLKVEYITKFPD